MRKKYFERFLEILPGATTWTALFLPIVASFFYPIGVVIFILCFDLYWVYKAFLMGFHLISGFRAMKRDLKINWLEKCQKIQPSSLIKDWRKIYQAVILATYKEELDILRPSIESIVKALYPKKRIIFVLATEERDKERARKNALVLREEFGRKFFAFLVTEHPEGIPGEVRAKGANVTWAGRKLKKFLDKKKIEYEDVIVSTADADTRFHPQYFGHLSYKYCLNPNRTRRSFQPIPIFSNNIWEAPALTRIAAFTSSFWQMIEATRPHRLINFSTHAMSMQALVDIDFWDVSVVNEDSRQFWRAYYAFDGDHAVVPLFLPVYMDAVLANTFFETIKSQYLQRLRWAYGIEHFPYVVLQNLKNKNIFLLDKWFKTYRLFEASFSWATASIFVAVIGWIPFLLNPSFHNTVLARNVPILARDLLGLTWIGLIISAYIAMALSPPRPPKYGKGKTLGMILQWILVPLTSNIFGSIPAIHAQTRLMIGRYLTFRVTEKKRFSLIQEPSLISPRR